MEATTLANFWLVYKQDYDGGEISAGFSHKADADAHCAVLGDDYQVGEFPFDECLKPLPEVPEGHHAYVVYGDLSATYGRSEEHTSELQSH